MRIVIAVPAPCVSLVCAIWSVARVFEVVVHGYMQYFCALISTKSSIPFSEHMIRTDTQDNPRAAGRPKVGPALVE